MTYTPPITTIDAAAELLEGQARNGTDIAASETENRWTIGVSAKIYDNTNLSVSNAAAIWDNSILTTNTIAKICDNTSLTTTRAAQILTDGTLTNATEATIFDNSNLSAGRGANIFDDAEYTNSEVASVWADTSNLTDSHLASYLESTNLTISNISGALTDANITQATGQQRFEATSIDNRNLTGDAALWYIIDDWADNKLSSRDSISTTATDFPDEFAQGAFRPSWTVEQASTTDTSVSASNGKLDLSAAGNGSDNAGGARSDTKTTQSGTPDVGTIDNRFLTISYSGNNEFHFGHSNFPASDDWERDGTSGDAAQFMNADQKRHTVVNGSNKTWNSVSIDWANTHDVRLTWDGSTSKMYIDGTQVNSISDSNAVSDSGYKPGAQVNDGTTTSINPTIEAFKSN